MGNDKALALLKRKMAGKTSDEEKKKSSALDNLVKKKAENKQEEEVATGEGICEVALDVIMPNPYQPRKKFKDIEKLAENIEAHGLLQPIVLGLIKGQHYIIAGERRYRAHKLLAGEGKEGFNKVKAIVLNDVSNKNLKVLAVIENIQRDDMTMIEIVYAYKALSDEGYSLAQIAKEVSKGRNTIKRYLKIANLSPEHLDLIEKLEISSPNKIEKIVDAGLSSKDTTELIQKVGKGASESQIEFMIKKIKAPKNLVQKENNEELFAKAAAPIKKRAYLSLEGDGRKKADELLKEIVEAKMKLSELIK